MKDKHNLLKLLGLRIRESRIRLGLSQEELAFKADMDRTYISGVERGVRNPTFISLVVIAAALDTSVSHLLADLGD